MFGERRVPFVENTKTPQRCLQECHQFKIKVTALHTDSAKDYKDKLLRGGAGVYEIDYEKQPDQNYKSGLG